MEVKPDGPLVKLSQQLYMAAKVKDNTDSMVVMLAAASYAELQNELHSENTKKAFWINCYNAFVQILLSKDASIYKTRGKFFLSRNIVVAGKYLSLDDIEHGILRHSKVKWAMGYLGKLFPSSFEKEMRVNKTDYRIHFTLNCGAMSCPAIAFYNSDKLEQQLELATRVYLMQECEYIRGENKIYVPAIMGWFRNDFRGRRGMIHILKVHKIITDGITPSIKFKKYNWKLFLENYKN